MTTNAQAWGRFAWYDLNTTDMEGAASFYSELIGWGVERQSSTGMAYWHLIGPRGPLGGIMQLPEEARKMGAPPHWVAYAVVENVDATVSRAVELGGAVLLPPMDIPKVGRFSVLKDPWGATFCAFAGADEAPGLEDGGRELKEYCWHELATPDPEGSLKFYQALFGWEQTGSMELGADVGTYKMFGSKARSFGGMMKKPAAMPGPPSFWLYYINVGDVAGAIEKAKKLGATVLNGPEDIPGGGAIAQLLDPQGAAFALHKAPDKKG